MHPVRSSCTQPKTVRVMSRAYLDPILGLEIYPSSRMVFFLFPLFRILTPCTHIKDSTLTTCFFPVSENSSELKPTLTAEVWILWRPGDLWRNTPRVERLGAKGERQLENSQPVKAGCVLEFQDIPWLHNCKYDVVVCCA